MRASQGKSEAEKRRPGARISVWRSAASRGGGKEKSKS